MTRLMYSLLCYTLTTVFMWIIVFKFKKEKRYRNLVIATIVVPIIVLVLWGTCFFETVPHCTACIIVPEGEEAPICDANELKADCMLAYFVFQLIATIFVVKNNVSKGKRTIATIVIIGLSIYIGGMTSAISYM